MAAGDWAKGSPSPSVGDETRSCPTGVPGPPFPECRRRVAVQQRCLDVPASALLSAPFPVNRDFWTSLPHGLHRQEFWNPDIPVEFISPSDWGLLCTRGYTCEYMLFLYELLCSLHPLPKSSSFLDAPAWASHLDKAQGYPSGVCTHQNKQRPKHTPAGLLSEN